MSKHIYQAKQVVRQDSQGVYRTVHLQELSWVYDCPDCEYVMTALTEENAEALERMHVMSMPSTHLERWGEDRWPDFVGQFTSATERLT